MDQKKPAVEGHPTGGRKLRCRVTRIMTMALMVICVMALTSSALAATGTAGTAIQDAVKSGMGEAYEVISAIALPIAGVALAFSAFQFFFNGEKGAQIAKGTIIGIIVGLALAYLGPVIVGQVGTWFSDVGKGGIFS